MKVYTANVTSDYGVLVSDERIQATRFDVAAKRIAAVALKKARERGKRVKMLGIKLDLVGSITTGHQREKLWEGKGT